MQAGMLPGLFLLWFVLEAAYLIAEGDAGGHAAGAVEVTMEELQLGDTPVAELLHPRKAVGRPAHVLLEGRVLHTVPAVPLEGVSMATGSRRT